MKWEWGRLHHPEKCFAGCSTFLFSFSARFSYSLKLDNEWEISINHQRELCSSLSWIINAPHSLWNFDRNQLRRSFIRFCEHRWSWWFNFRSRVFVVIVKTNFLSKSPNSFSLETKQRETILKCEMKMFILTFRPDE